ncbi:hypothetical protein FB451DRAFT_1211014 [Mycena latifolia]|nr:hypothetical protein FB451DRAFT_1211014 [Mycena latifolia]
MPYPTCTFFPLPSSMPSSPSSRHVRYVVIVGKQVGIFNTWLEVAPLVNGVSNSSHQSFSSEEKAVNAYSQACRQGNVKVVGGTTAVSATTSPARETIPSSQLPVARAVPVLSGEPQWERDLRRSRGPLLTTKMSGSSRSRPSDLPVTVKSEANDSELSSSQYPSSSPPTGITQVVCLSSSSSNGLSPLALPGKKLEPDNSSVPLAQGAPSRASRASSKSGSSAALVELSSGDDTSSPPTAMNPTSHIRCSACGEINILASAMAASSLSQGNPIPPAMDPRSPLSHPGSLCMSSRRPSPRMGGELDARSALFSG